MAADSEARKPFLVGEEAAAHLLEELPKTGMNPDLVEPLTILNGLLDTFLLQEGIDPSTMQVKQTGEK